MGRSKVHTQLGPRIKVILGSDSATNTAIPTNRPVLLESRSALDRRLVGTGGLEDVVGTAVGLDGAFLGRCGAGIVRAVGLDDVVFDQRVLGPAVDAEIAVSIDVVAAGVLDGSILLVSDVYAIDEGEERECTGRCQGSSPFQRQSCRHYSSRRCTRLPDRCCR